MGRMFPEIQNTTAVQAQTRSEDAMMDPRAIKVDAIIAYKEHAVVMRKEGNAEAAQLYEKLAASLESEIAPGGQQLPPGGGGGSLPNIANEVMPGGANEPTTGLGEM